LRLNAWNCYRYRDWNSRRRRLLKEGYGGGENRGPQGKAFAPRNAVSPEGSFFAAEMAVGLQENTTVMGMEDAVKIDDPLGRVP
jgi:hypothetical protein